MRLCLGFSYRLAGQCDVAAQVLSQRLEKVWWIVMCLRCERLACPINGEAYGSISDSQGDIKGRGIQNLFCMYRSSWLDLVLFHSFE